MSNIATALKTEISRIARKEIRSETEALKKASSRYRAEIADLKRQIVVLTRQLTKAKSKTATESTTGEETETTKFRFRVEGLKSHRERLGVTAKDMAKLLDVSVQTLANWESGKTKPRASQLGTIAAVRKLGKRQVAKRLAGE